MNKKQISINIVSGFISSGVTLLVSFFLTPYLVKTLGDEAYGYIGLSGNFIIIAGIFTTALNSMANRFILIAYEKKDNEKINEYFSSLFAAGIVLASAFLIIGLLGSFYIDKIFNITPQILGAVKVTFILAIVNFAVMTLCTVFSASVFVKNRLDFTAKADIIANLAKLIFLISIFSIATPQIYYVSIGGLIYTVILYFGHIRNTKKLLPTVKIKLALARIKTIKELISSGVWNSFTSIIQMLMVGLDLALANWLLDGRAMGLIAISNTIIVACNSILVVVINSFKPTLTKTYAGGDLEELHRQVKISNKMQCAIMFVPIAGLCIFAPKFYSLWLPYKSHEDIILLSLITFVKVFDQFAGLTTDAIRNNFIFFNKLKASVLVRLLLSILNVPIVILIVYIFNDYTVSILAISGISSLLYLIYYWAMEPMLVSKITGQKISEYYKIIVQAVLMFVMLIIPFAIINSLTVCASWVQFGAVVAFTGIIGYTIMWTKVTNSEDRAAVYKKIKEKVGRNKG